jgi:hypothetical protein
LKHFSCTLLLNQFGPFSNSWHVAVNSDVKHTMHGMVDDTVMHDACMHDMGMHDVDVHNVAVHFMGMPVMAVPSTDVYKT